MAKEVKKGLSPADLLWDLRDTSDLIEGTDEVSKTSQAFLFWVLTAHVRADQKYGTFVGYPELARITGMSQRTLKRAADALEKSGLIERKVRPHHSNITHVNVNRIHEAALANRAQWKTEREDQWNTTFELPAGKETDEPGVSDVEIRSSKPIEVDADDVNRVLTLLSQNFGNHKTYEDKDADRIMRGCMRDCVGIAGSVERVEHVLEWVLADRDRVGAIDRSRKLGAFIRTCLSGWLEEMDQAESADPIPEDDEPTQQADDDYEYAADDGDEDVSKEEFREAEDWRANEREEYRRYVMS